MAETPTQGGSHIFRFLDHHSHHSHSWQVGVSFHFDSRNMTQLARKMAFHRGNSLVLLLAEPFNVTPSTLPNLLTATFTWSPQTIESLRSAHTHVDLQILPLRGLFHLFSSLKSAECVSSSAYTQ